MENETENQITGQQQSFFKKDYFLPVSILAAAIILAGSWLYTNNPRDVQDDSQDVEDTSDLQGVSASVLEGEVLPPDGVILPVRWNDLGKKLVDAGAIDADQFKAIYEDRSAFTDEYESLLLGENNGQLKITNENSGYLLNLLWALGLANKNPILDTGEMTNPAYGGAQNFASTGGWTLAKGNAMDHYSAHQLFSLTPEQQDLVDKVSNGIYRPCCGNSTHFPDCNHGMAMLGLLELMASQGVSEEDMWKAALVVNSYWFPDTYLTIATYMNNQGVDWQNINPQEVLGADYSSASGYKRVFSQVTPPERQGGGGGCGV